MEAIAMGKVLNFPTDTEPTPGAVVREMKLRRTDVIGVRVPRQLNLWLQKRADEIGYSKSTTAAIILLDYARCKIRKQREDEAKEVA